MASEAPTCGYCMEQLKNMKDPRSLPCGHIFCFGCLQGDFSAGGVDTKCNQCGKNHSGLDLAELPEAGEGNEDEDEGKCTLPPVTCSKTCKNNAICFCKDCSAAMCEEHKQAHDIILVEHTYVPFDEFRKLPKKYERPMCVSHNKGLTLACEDCDVLVCEECDLTSPCNQGNRNQHKFRSLAKSMKQFTSDYGKLIQSVSEQHSTFTKKQKETEATFEELVVNYNLEEKLAAVDLVAEQQIAEIRRRAEVKKKEMKKFPELMDVKVTTYSEGLAKKEQQLDDLEKALSKQMRELHIVDVIRRNKENRQKITAAQALETGNCDILRQMVVAPTGRFTDIEIMLRPLLPSKLVKFFNSFPNGGRVEMVTLTDQGDVLVYCSNRVQLLDTHGKRVKFSANIPNLVSMAQYKEFIFIAVHQNQSLICARLSVDGPTYEKIFSFRTNHSSGDQQIIVRAEEVIAIDNSSYSHQLRIYDIFGTHVRNVSLMESVCEICALPGNFVLLKNNHGIAQKYDITSSSAIKVWRSAKNAFCFTTDRAGLIYGTVHTYNKAPQKMRLFRPKSKSDAHIQELLLEERKPITSVSVNSNMLAVLSNGFCHLYYIEF